MTLPVVAKFYFEGLYAIKAKTTAEAIALREGLSRTRYAGLRAARAEHRISWSVALYKAHVIGHLCRAARCALLGAH